MSDNNIPDKNIKNSNMPEDEEIIDLNEVVQDTSEGPEGDDDIIDLTEAVTEDDDILDLTDVAAEEPEGQAGDDEIIDLVDSLGDEEDVIELTDVEEAEPAQDDMPDEEPIVLEEETAAAEIEEQDEIPVEEKTEPDVQETAEESEEDVDQELLELIESINDDDFIGSEIEDAAVDEQEQAESDEDLLEPDEEIVITGDGREESDSEEKKVFAESLDEDLGSVLTYSDDNAESEVEGEKILDRPGVVSVKVQDLRDEGRPVDFKFESKLKPGDKIFREKDYNKVITRATAEQVEEAVRKVIQEMLADKIDGLITDVIEKKVLQEIDRIKNLLLDDAENRK
jgi:hypothetical protein